MIRKATAKDIVAIRELGIESVSKDPIPVRISKSEIDDSIREGLGNNHFLWVSEIDGEVVAVFGAMSHPSFWFERQQCSVMVYYTRVPGEGIKLLREFVRWVKNRPVIKVAVMELEPDADPRMLKYLRRLGFSRTSMNASYVRGMTDV